jgi:putative SOS response-associated peptidase YedK
MCANYRPGSRDFIRERVGREPDFEWPDEVYPAAPAPIIRRAADGGLECARACFGLLPPWARDMRIARNTYNARSETVAQKPSYRHAWQHAQFCLVPMAAFYEPNYETGRSVRWRIERADGAPFAVAAIWEGWHARGAERVLSFSLLTINADAHPLMRRFHAPGDEKRSLVVIAPQDYDAWLAASPEHAGALLQPFAAEAFTTGAAPRPPAARRAAHT